MMLNAEGGSGRGEEGERKNRWVGLFYLIHPLLVLLSILCGYAAIIDAGDGDQERRAIAQLVQRGAVVKRFDQQVTGIDGLLVRLGDDYGVDRRIIRKEGTVDPEVIDLLLDLDDLTVEIRGTTLSDDGLKSLCTLSHLQGLDISGSQITDDGIEHLNDLRDLVLLDLSLTNITDAGFAELQPMKSLGTLSLQGTQVSERSLPHLLKFSGMKSLFLPLGFTEKTLHAFSERHPECRVRIESD